MPRAPRPNKTFLGLHLYLVGKYCENPKVPGAQLDVNLARAITWFEGVTIYCTFFNYNSPPPRQFFCNKLLLKKISYSKGNAHWSNFELRGPGPLGRIYYVLYSYNWLFNDKTIISTENIRLDCYLLLKYCRRQCTLFPLTWAKSLTKFDPKIQNFKRILDLNCLQKKDWKT